MWDLTATLLASGMDVILDFGFWWVEEREQVARHVISMGAKPSWHYLDTPTDTLLARMAERNADPSYMLKIPVSYMEHWIETFQPPTHDEALHGLLETIT